MQNNTTKRSHEKQLKKMGTRDLGGWWYFQVPWDYHPLQPEIRHYMATPQSTESLPSNELPEFWKALKRIRERQNHLKNAIRLAKKKKIKSREKDKDITYENT